MPSYYNAQGCEIQEQTFHALTSVALMDICNTGYDAAVAYAVKRGTPIRLVELAVSLSIEEKVARIQKLM